MSGSSDPFSSFLGVWKRTLHWRSFGSDFAFLKSTSSVVRIERVQAKADEVGCSELVKWRFGSSLDDMDNSYSMALLPNPDGSFHAEWTVDGLSCHGTYIPQTSTLILHFAMSGKTIVEQYHAEDTNTLAVCIVETSDREASTMQYGHMLRLDGSSA